MFRCTVGCCLPYAVYFSKIRRNIIATPSGVDFNSINEETFALYVTGGEQIASTVFSIDPATGRITITAVANVDAGDTGDLSLLTGAASPIDMNGNRHAVGANISVVPVNVPPLDPTIDDVTPPIINVISAPPDIVTAGQHSLVWVLEVVDVG